MSSESRFSIGDIVYHTEFNYRGVIYDVDPQFMLADDWYQNVALSRPPKDRPWYRVLVHNRIHETYVAERNLMLDESHAPINHPATQDLFEAFEGDHYTIKIKSN